MKIYHEDSLMFEKTASQNFVKLQTELTLRYANLFSLDFLTFYVNEKMK